MSARRRTSRIMASPLCNFVGWRLVIDCAGSRCPRGRAYDVSQLAELYRGVTVSAALRRMRCSQCRCSPAAAAVKSPYDDRQLFRDNQDGFRLSGAFVAEAIRRSS
jgi:hypothetical protein